VKKFTDKLKIVRVKSINMSVFKVASPYMAIRLVSKFNSDNCAPAREKREEQAV